MILIGGITSAQLPISYTFNNRDDISQGRVDSGIKSYPWNNGVVFIGYCYDSVQTKEGFTLTFYDTLGVKLWSKIYFLDYYKYFQANDIISYNNSSFYIGGVIYKDSINQWDRFFAKFNSNGDSVFLKYYEDPEINWMMDFEKFSNDTILMLSAKTVSDASEYTKTVICKVDTFGNISKTYEGPYNLCIPYKILKGANCIYVGGSRKTNIGGNGTYNIKVFIDFYDHYLTFYYSKNPSIGVNEYFNNFFILNNQLYLSREVTQWDNVYQNYFDKCRISIHTLTCDLLKSVDIGPPNGNASVGSVIPIDSQIIVVQNWFSLYFIDKNLNILCNTTDLCFPNYDRGFGSLSILPNKMIAGTGMYYPDTISSQDHWNFLTENIDNYIYNSTLKIPENEVLKKEITLYPNPANNTLTLDFIQQQNTTLSIFDIQGKQLLYQNITEVKTELDISSFAKGIYIIKVQSDKEILQSKFVKN